MLHKTIEGIGWLTLIAAAAATAFGLAARAGLVPSD